MLQSVDVSWPQQNYQPGAESGVFVAATSADGGTLFTQSTFAGDVANARAAGKEVGFYHFNGRTNNASPAAQADYFWSVIQPYYRPGDALALDVESSESGKYRAWTVAEAAEFIARLTVLAGTNRIGIYGNRTDMRSPGWGALEKAGCWLWLAAPGGYPENTAVGEWSHWTILQYSSAGAIDRDESESTFAQIASLEDDMPDMNTFLNTAAFTGGPTISTVLQRASILYDAIMQGGPSMKDNHESLQQSIAEIHAAVKANSAAPTIDYAALSAAMVKALPALPTSALTEADVETALRTVLQATVFKAS
ncbi:glycoside hydrolase family 25 protein [Leifsonia sp. NPDC056824]|uniref:glycoside hydrolase family 25 protein n=1 Tax=Leifsonia sp. NPDC056824 TaxID=3345953 RepID=UPI0036C54703